MTQLTDNFQFDTGQITVFLPVVTSGTAWGTDPSNTAVITGGQLVFTAAPATGGSVIEGELAQENAWTIPADTLSVIMKIGTPTWQQPLPSGNAHFGVGIVKDASNCVMFELGPDQSSTSLTYFIYGIIAGTSFAFNGSLSTSSLPDALAFGLVGNIVTAYISFGGIFQAAQFSGVGGGGLNVDVSSFYDFTAGGALTGWCPGGIWGQNAGIATPTQIAAAEFIYDTPFVSPIATVPTPSVLGDTQSAATTAITGAGLVLGAVTTQVSTATAGTVINQNPSGGVQVLPGTAVDIVLAIPGPTTTVPNLVNTSVAVVAPGLLAAANLVLGGITDMPSGTVIAGNVISQNPAAGTTVLQGSGVNVVVSSGLPSLTIPDLFGLTQQDAINLLVSIGFVPGAIGSAPSQFVAPGEVQAQNPSAGAPAAPGTIVSFVLSQGTPLAGTVFDFEQTVISQYANSPTILQLCQNLNQYIDQSANFANFYNFVWNVDTAVGFGLDIWGTIVDVARLLRIPNSTAYVGFDIASESQPDQDWTPAGSDQPPYNNPPVGGAMYTGNNATEAYLLNDDAYRQLILAKAFANICTTTAPAINQILQNLYGAGTAWVLNDGPMAISYNLSFNPTAIQLAILEQSGVIPTPPGVAVTINTNV